jgi:S1-C subfamily serine protease
VCENDLIVFVDGRKIASFSDLQPALAGKRAGDEVSMTLMRRGEEHTFAVVLQSPSGW